MFLLCWYIQLHEDFIKNQDISGYVIILGWLVAPVLNTIWVLGWIFRKVGGKKTATPNWIGFCNTIFLIIEAYALLLHGK